MNVKAYNCNSQAIVTSR